VTNEVKSFLQLLKCIDEDFLGKELKGKVHKRNYWGLKRKVLCRFSSRRERQTESLKVQKYPTSDCRAPYPWAQEMGTSATVGTSARTNGSKTSKNFSICWG